MMEKTSKYNLLMIL